MKSSITLRNTNTKRIKRIRNITRKVKRESTEKMASMVMVRYHTHTNAYFR